MKNKLKKYMLVLFMLCIVLFGINAHAEETQIISSNETEEPFMCGTDSEFAQERYNELLKRRFSEDDNWEIERNVNLFSMPFGSTARKTYMPSTGEVKVLVLPIEFKDEKLSDNIYDKLQEVFFSQHDIADSGLEYRDLSVCDYYRKVSFNKLRLSGMVLPVYSAKENREYYGGEYDGEDYGEYGAKRMLVKEIVKAINLNKDIIGNLSDYDADNDGYIDCLNIVWAGKAGKWATTWWGEYKYERDTVLYDNIKIGGYVGLPESSAGVHTFSHEIGHALGLPDNYFKINHSNNVLPDGVNELMKGDGYYINSLYKYLLDWENPEILPYEDITKEIEIYASDVYNDLETDKQRSVVFVPNYKNFPFTEFYIMEYRTSIRRGDTGTQIRAMAIFIWHCKLKEYSYIPETVREKADVIQPVYKSCDKTEYFKTTDVYYEGDEWSSETNPSSDFYDNIYTGAYMKVLNTDNEKATLLVGFKEPDLISAPTLTISPPSRKAVKKGISVEYKLTYENADFIENWFGNWYADHVTGNAEFWGENANVARGELTIEPRSGDGTYGFTILAGSAYKTGEKGGRAYAPKAVSEVFYVDNTPPEIKLNGESEITLERGAEYIEFGAEITDNLDPDIESKLNIDYSAVDTNKEGTYVVRYSASDHAENTQTETRTVKVVSSGSRPFTAYEKYSTTELTNEDVTVEIMPSRAVTADTKLSHTFTENGSYTFTLMDLAGNKAEKTVTVDWIDKNPPTAEVEYSTQLPTQNNVTVTLFPNEAVTDNTELSYTFEENGSHTFTLTDLAGNVSEKIVDVTWIYKTPPTAEVEYSTTEPTRQDVTVSLIPSREVTADSILTHTFTENGSYTFTFEDLAGNKAEKTVEVTWIDREPPEIRQIRYHPNEITNRDVLLIILPSEKIIEGTSVKHTFTENGTYTIVMTDLAGNVAEIPITVDWIDKKPPTAEIEYSTTNLTGSSVTAKLVNLSEQVQETELEYVFEENGKHDFTITDLAGNKTKLTAEVTWIDRTLPTAEVQYSVTEPTNSSVTATLVNIPEGVQVSELSHVFEENGTYDFTLTNSTGKTVTITAKVDWIDKTPPSATVEYSETEPTQGNVTARLVNVSEEIQETDLSYEFTENVTHDFVITDKVGNSSIITASVNWIDREAPTAEISYSATKPTNNDVTVTLIPSEVVQETELSHTFTENGSYSFTITDLAGNKAMISVVVDWIDKTPPSATVEYSETEPTQGNVTARIVNVSEEIQETDLSYEFTENGTHDFIITDKAGNTTTISAEVTWIDRTPPTAEVEYSTTEPTTGTVMVSIVPSEQIRETELAYTFTKNGEYIFTFTDIAGNIGTAEAKVDWIMPVFEIQKNFDGTVCNIIVRNTFEEKQSGQLIIAEYMPSGEMINVEVTDYVSDENDVVTDYNMQDEMNEVRVFIWEDLNTMKPLV